MLGLQSEGEAFRGNHYGELAFLARMLKIGFQFAQASRMYRFESFCNFSANAYEPGWPGVFLAFPRTVFRYDGRIRRQ